MNGGAPLPSWLTSTLSCCGVGLLLASCAATPADDTLPPPGSESGASVQAQERPVAPRPPQVGASDDSRIDAWTCDGQLTPVSIYRRANDTMDLYFQGTLRTLQRTALVPPAYSDGAVTLRLDPDQTGADSAVLQVLPMRARCQLDRVASLELRAWQRGARFIGRGNEPGWQLEVHGQHALWITDYGSTRLTFDDLQPLTSPAVPQADAAAAAERILARGADGDLDITLVPGLCVDDGDVAYPASVRLEYQGRVLRGCGRRLRDPGLPGFEQGPAVD